MRRERQSCAGSAPQSEVLGSGGLTKGKAEQRVRNQKAMRGAKTLGVLVKRETEQGLSEQASCRRGLNVLGSGGGGGRWKWKWKGKWKWWRVWWLFQHTATLPRWRR